MSVVCFVSPLQVVLCFSPVGSTLRVRSRKFPAVTNCTSIDWFHEWPEGALISVSARFLEEVELLSVSHCFSGELEAKSVLLLPPPPSPLPSYLFSPSVTASLSLSVSLPFILSLVSVHLWFAGWLAGWLVVSLSVCLPACLPACLPVCLSVSFYLSTDRHQVTLSC